MKNKIQYLIIKILGQKYFKVIYTTVNRFSKRENRKICIEDSLIVKMEEYNIQKKESFFGYYDINPFSDDGNKMLTMIVDKHSAEVGYFNIQSKKYHIISNTNSWNWQMGCRLRWINNDRVMFNDFDGEKYICRICDLFGTEIKRYPTSFFDIDVKNKYAYYLDFSALHYFRAGYGYENIPFNENAYNLEENGLYRYDLVKDEKKLILSIKEINQKFPTKYDELYTQYINHISVNTINGMIMFFQIWIEKRKKKNKKSRIIVCDNNGKIIQIVDNFQQVSHYCWKTKEELMLTVINNSKVEYRLCNIVTGNFSILHQNTLKEDGHPSYIEKDKFITDTYPNRYGMQMLYLCSKKNVKKIFSIYHNPYKIKEFRCDLHPHYFQNMIHIDANMARTRTQIILFLNKRNM